jgi:hypothetical protein
MTPPPFGFHLLKLHYKNLSWRLPKFAIGEHKYPCRFAFLNQLLIGQVQAFSSPGEPS